MDALLDTQTGTYLTNDSVQSIENEVYIRLITPLGSYWADANLGSRLHLLKREKDVIRIQTLARQYAEQALQPILDHKRATSIRVQTESVRRGWLKLWIEAVDANGRKVNLEHQVSVL